MLPAEKIVADFAARLDETTKRVDRLETLEFGTVAFPSGGGMICFEHFELAVDGGGHSFAAIPQTHRHLLLTYKVRSPAGTTGNGLHVMRINGDFAANYGQFGRFKFFGAALEANFLPGTNTVWSIGLVSADDVAPNLDLNTGEWTNGWMLLEDYTSTDKKKTCHLTEFGYVGSATNPRGATTGNVFNEGGGHYELLTAITSLDILQTALPPPFVYGAGSQWTLFGLCPITVEEPPPPE